MTDPRILEILKRLQGGAAQTILSDERFNELHQREVEFALNWVKTHGSMIPSFNVHGIKRGNSKETMVLPCLFGDWPPPNKQATFAGLGVKFAQDYPEFMPIMTTTASEAWLARYENEADAQNPKVLPSGRSDRIEVVTIASETMDMRTHFTNKKMVRNGNGRLSHFEDHSDTISKPGDDPHKSVNHHWVWFMMGYFKAKYPDTTKEWSL